MEGKVQSREGAAITPNGCIPVMCIGPAIGPLTELSLRQSTDRQTLTQTRKIGLVDLPRRFLNKLVCIGFLHLLSM